MSDKLITKRNIDEEIDLMMEHANKHVHYTGSVNDSISYHLKMLLQLKREELKGG